MLLLPYVWALLVGYLPAFSYSGHSSNSKIFWRISNLFSTVKKIRFHTRQHQTWNSISISSSIFNWVIVQFECCKVASKGWNFLNSNQILFWMSQTRPLSLYLFVLFKYNFTEQTVGLSGIQTRIVQSRRWVGWPLDRLPLPQFKYFYNLSLKETSF